MLSRFQDMKYEDIAAVLGCEVGTVKVRVFRAMRALEQVYFTLAGRENGMTCDEAKLLIDGLLEPDAGRNAGARVRGAHRRRATACRAETERLGALWKSLALIPGLEGVRAGRESAEPVL